jgi:hypothetical protein
LEEVIAKYTYYSLAASGQNYIIFRNVSRNNNILKKLKSVNFKKN